MSQPKRGRQMLIGCTGFLLVVTLILGSFIAWNWQDLSARAANFRTLFAASEYLSGLSSSEDVLGFVEQHRDTTALAVATVKEDGTVEFPADLQHNQDEQLPLASTMKIVVLAAYARAVEQGQLTLDMPIPLVDWQAYYLPKTDGGAHLAALAELGIATDQHGFASDPAATATLDQLARAMIRFSDNAATDYLLTRLGPAAIQSVIVDAKLSSQEPILPITGTFLSWQNHEQPAQSDAHRDELLAMNASVYASEVMRLQAAYLDPTWRAAEVRWRTEQAVTSRVEYEAALAQGLMPRGSASDYASMMANVVGGRFLSAEVAATMRRYLEWPMEKPGNQANFRAFGTKGGSVSGVLTEAMYLVPNEGDYAGQQQVVVLFMNEMPFAAWYRMSQTFAHQRFMVDIATKREFAVQVAQQLSSDGIRP